MFILLLCYAWFSPSSGQINERSMTITADELLTTISNDGRFACLSCNTTDFSKRFNCELKIGQWLANDSIAVDNECRFSHYMKVRDGQELDGKRKGIDFLARGNKIVVHSIRNVDGKKKLIIKTFDVRTCHFYSSEYTHIEGKDPPNRLIELGDGFGVFTADEEICKQTHETLFGSGISKCIVIHDENGSRTNESILLPFGSKPIEKITPILDGVESKGIILSRWDNLQIDALYISEFETKGIISWLPTESEYIVAGAKNSVTFCGRTHYIFCVQYIIGSNGEFHISHSKIMINNSSGVVSMNAFNLEQYGFWLLTVEKRDEDRTYLKLVEVFHNKQKNILFDEEILDIDENTIAELKITDAGEKYCSHLLESSNYKNWRYFNIHFRRYCRPKVSLD
ncbi:hypothetical protein QAD02_006616 [Eretmocerus hayati]|uniref:Uncharacterized protein n=1 Tax=Eretmocerus hayati TaxID=131215 RepID=A0ACC2N3Q9_9HYME|nr:hypothetical protein QAD02_006616 [Eretmocerus hayati]